MLKTWKSDSYAGIAKKKTPSVWSRLLKLVRYLLSGCQDIDMLYENGKPKKDNSGGSIDLSEVEKLIRSSNAELLSSIVQQLRTSSGYSAISNKGVVSEEDLSKETMSQLAKMMGEKRIEEGAKDIGRKIEINSDPEKDKNTVNLLRELG